MHSNILRFVQKLSLQLACAALLGASALAAPLTLHKVATPPALHPLAMSTGGRMLTKPSAAANNFGSKNYTYQWPGTYFRAAFKGPRVFFRIVAGRQILHIVVDDQPGAPLVQPTAGVYEVEGLSKGKHTISVFVATESQAAPNTFGGFAIPSGETSLPLPPRHRQIEFIGDSFTVGFGNLSPTHKCTDQQVWADTDDPRAFGPITARHYNADYQVNAISGRGVVRNYNGFKGDTLPQAYPYVLFDKQNKYSNPDWNPQILVVGLGTNDFSTPLNPGEQWKTRAELHSDFESTYLHLLEQLRARNPKAYIIVWAADVAKGEVEVEAQKVVQQLKQRGFAHIAYLPINGLSFTACDGHPSLADDKIISGKLVSLIDADQPSWTKP